MPFSLIMADITLLDMHIVGRAASPKRFFNPGSRASPARTPLQDEQQPGGSALVAPDPILQVNTFHEYWASTRCACYMILSSTAKLLFIARLHAEGLAGHIVSIGYDIRYPNKPESH